MGIISSMDGGEIRSASDMRFALELLLTDAFKASDGMPTSSGSGDLEFVPDPDGVGATFWIRVREGPQPIVDPDAITDDELAVIDEMRVRNLGHAEVRKIIEAMARLEPDDLMSSEEKVVMHAYRTAHRCAGLTAIKAVHRLCATRRGSRAG